MIHTVKGFVIVNEAEVDIFLGPSHFFDDAVDVGNLIFGSSAFSKSCLNIWKFIVHIPLNLAWRILNIIFWCVRWVHLCGSLNLL